MYSKREIIPCKNLNFIHNNFHITIYFLSKYNFFKKKNYSCLLSLFLQ